MSLALPFLKRQLCLNSRLRIVPAYGRAQSTLLERLAQLTSQLESSPSSVPNSSTSTAISVTSPDALSEHQKAKKELKSSDATKLKGPSRNLLEESKIQSYLDHIAETGNTVTLADITRLRPNVHSDPETPEYEEEYNALIDRLCRSFSKKQLYSFVKMLEIEGSRRGSAKRHSAVQIVEDGWNWPSLAKMKARKRDWSEVLSQSFPLDPRQSFLILGKDGANLHALSNKYNIHIGFTTRPLSLNAEGLRGALKQLEKHITFVKEDIVEEYYGLSFEKPIPAELLHRISRLSGAFTETFGEGQIRISYRKSDPRRAAFIAKRLLTHVLCDLETVTGSSILVHIPPEVPESTPIPLAMFPSSYALYPFLSTRSLPWNVNASGAFRARKVAEWIGINPMEDVQKSGGLELGRGQVLDMEGNTADLRQKLFSHLPEPSGSNSRVVSASFGHVLLTPPPSSHASFIPPLQGSWPLSNLSRWIRERHIGRLFTPFLPAPVLQLTPQKQQLLHRLLYEAHPAGNTQQSTHVIEFEMVLPLATIDQNGIPELARSKFDSRHEESSIYTPGTTHTCLDNSCRIGNQFTVDLMLPDRPMDIRFSVFDSSVLPQKLWPTELQKYFEDLSFFFYDGESNASPPNAPVTMFLDNVEYRLRSSVSVRQTQADTHAPQSEISIPAISESILDLEVDDKSTVCKIDCHAPSTDEDWRAFLKGCDFMSAMRIPSSGKTFIDADTDIAL